MALPPARGHPQRPIFPPATNPYGDNVFGRRVFKKTAAGTVHFIHDPNGKLVMKYDASNAIVTEYVWIENQLLARIDVSGICSADLDMDGDVDGKDLAGAVAASVNIAGIAAHFGETGCLDGSVSVYYYHTDHLGTPLVMTDSSGSIVWKAHYLPFGKVTVSPSSVIQNNIRFPGQYFDAETDLHYNWHRYYDPDTGRYLTPDPIGLAGGINLYAYVLNDPVNHFDITGLIGGGLGAYIGFGGEGGINVITCCEENGKKYRFVILTICGGVGIGAKNVPAPPKNVGISFEGFSSDHACPQNKTYIRHDISFFTHIIGVNGNLTGKGPPISADVSESITGCGVTWKLCGDTVLNKKEVSSCCE